MKGSVETQLITERGDAFGGRILTQSRHRGIAGGELHQGEGGQRDEEEDENQPENTADRAPYTDLGARSSHGWLLTRGLGLRRCPVLVLNLVVPGLDPHGPPDGTPLIRDSGTIAPAIAA